MNNYNTSNMAWVGLFISWISSNSAAGKILDNSNADVAVDQYHRYPVSLEILTPNQRMALFWSKLFSSAK